MISLKINNIEVQVPEGSTVLEAAKLLNLKIPTLCHLDLNGLGMINEDANCRICLVENKWGDLVPACNTLVKQGMEIHTDTLKVIKSRRTNIELLLSDHPKDCLVCAKNGDCELQDLASMANLKEIRYQGESIKHEIDNSSLSIIRDPNKCILCKRCETMCNNVQTVGTLTHIDRGFQTVIGTAYQQPMWESNCTFCGQCLAVCPTGALYEVSNVNKVYRALNDKKKTVIVQTAPAVRVALGEEFGMPAGSQVTGQMVSALKNMGFDYVFDTNFAADLTIMEEATEFVQRLKSDELPILTSCCPSWVKFIEHNFGDMLDIPSSCKSPHEMFGVIAKTYFAQKMKIDPENLVVVSVMPCVAKKYEAARPELGLDDKTADVDYVITTRELAGMIKDFGMDFENLEAMDFDDPMGESSGAGSIFGATGGVAEAALRTAYFMITGEELEELEFTELKGLKGIKEASLDIEGRPIKIAVSSGLGQARKILDRIRAGEKYDLIEIMACPGGCIGGGGQPLLHEDFSKLEKRKEAIHNVDRGKTVRRSHQNQSINKLYDEFLGEPGGERAHDLLHTSFFFREKYIKP